MDIYLVLYYVLIAFGTATARAHTHTHTEDRLYWTCMEMRGKQGLHKEIPLLLPLLLRRRAALVAVNDCLAVESGVPECYLTVLEKVY